MPELNAFRRQIDKIDKELLKILAKRFVITKKIGWYKKKHKLLPQDKSREKEIFEKRGRWAGKSGLDLILVKQLFKLIIKKVRKNHQETENEK